MIEWGSGEQPIHGSVDCYFLRLWIENEEKTRAEKVQVFISRVLREAPNRMFVPMESFIPMNLHGGFGSETPTHAEVFADGISPGMGAHCCFARVTDPAKRKQFGEDHTDAKPEQT